MSVTIGSLPGSGPVRNVSATPVTLVIGGLNTRTISAGTLQIGAGRTTGTLRSGNIVNNAALASTTLAGLGLTRIDVGASLDFNGQASVLRDLDARGVISNAVDTGIANGSITGALTGTGGLIKTTPGVLIMAGISTYQGATSIQAGTGSLPATLVAAGGRSLRATPSAR